MKILFFIYDYLAVISEHQGIVRPSIHIGQRFIQHVLPYDIFRKVGSRIIGKRISPTEPWIDLDPDHIIVRLSIKQLDVLKRDFTLGMITDGRSITQRNKFQALGLEQFIENENLVISEEFGSEKPSERNFMFFQDKYADAEFVYIGDNLRKDFITPNKLGWKTICLLDDGRNIHRQDFSCPEEYLPNVKIHTLKELLSL